MSTKTKSPLLSAPVLVVMLALLLAVAGVVYTHWTTSLDIDGQVQTGNVSVQWNEAWTNDDGVDNDDGEPVEGVYDGTGTSTDPMENAYNPARYDKDVGECYANGGGSSLGVNLWGVYPSYNCNMTGLVTVDGNVPVRATAFDFTGQKVWWNEAGNEVSAPLEIEWGTYEGNFTLGVGGPEIEGDIGMGVRCGAQLDPTNCEWRVDLDPRVNVLWSGPVSGDDEGPFADIDGNTIMCDTGTWPLMAAQPTECWVEGETNGVRDNGDLPATQDCGDRAVEVGGWLHVLQEADQNAQYSYTISQEFVNWNEFDYCMCTDGVPAADTSGAIIGVVDHSVAGCLSE